MDETIYILHDGTSEDGRGHGTYQTYTTDFAVARNFYLTHIKNNPYSTGSVVEMTKKSYRTLWEADFK